MTQTLVSGTSGATASRNLPMRILGVLFSPRATYADVAARPRALGVLAFVVLAGMAGVFLFMSSEVGQNAFIDQQVQQREAFGRPLTDEQYDRLEGMVQYAPYIGAAFQLVSLPVLAAIVAGIAFAVFNAVLGGDATFKQVFAVVTHSGVVLTVAQLFGLPLAYARETMSGATNLGIFVPFLQEDTFAIRFLGAIDLFILWWTVSLAIGLGVLYRKRTGPIATTLILIYIAIGIVVATVKTVMSGA